MTIFVWTFYIPINKTFFKPLCMDRMKRLPLTHSVMAYTYLFQSCTKIFYKNHIPSTLRILLCQQHNIIQIRQTKVYLTCIPNVYALWFVIVFDCVYGLEQFVTLNEYKISTIQHIIYHKEEKDGLAVTQKYHQKHEKIGQCCT